jgi:hypothetical protein
MCASEQPFPTFPSILCQQLQHRAVMGAILKVPGNDHGREALVNFAASAAVTIVLFVGWL